MITSRRFSIGESVHWNVCGEFCTIVSLIDACVKTKIDIMFSYHPNKYKSKITYYKKEDLLLIEDVIPYGSLDGMDLENGREAIYTSLITFLEGCLHKYDKKIKGFNAQRIIKSIKEACKAIGWNS